MCIISISLSPFMTQLLNLLSGQTKSICFSNCWQYFLTIFLPHWWHWVKSLLIVETIYLLNFVGWARVALVPTKWQIFNSNKLQIVLLWRTRAVLLSPVKWNTWRAYTLQNPFTPKLQFLKNVSFRIEKIRKWISKIYSKMEPMHINYNWSVHWKWIEIMFKDKWSKLVEFFSVQFQLKYCFHEKFYNSRWRRHQLDNHKYKKYFQFFCLLKDK